MLQRYELSIVLQYVKICLETCVFAHKAKKAIF